ncbi:MAG: hypothetical protein IPG74_11760 [Flavobacteriales bacterium]|nr:hypothetical protein [Flavobacteriales bacterium]
MRNRPIVLLVLMAVASVALAQRYDPLHPPNTFRNADNPYYWKNRPPFAGYWQQDVHYTIDGRMDDARNAFTAQEKLVYHNNSPDTLRFVFFHLYQEAYNAGSYAYKQRQGEGWDLRGTEDDPYAGTTVHEWKSGTVDLKTEQDNTVVKVWLDKPLAPGGKTVFDIRFTTHWTYEAQRRMKLFDAWGHKHFDGTHWYPRIAVYDRKMGWDTQQHLGSELYGDFGCFDVSLDFPADYVLEATGGCRTRKTCCPMNCASGWTSATSRTRNGTVRRAPSPRTTRWCARHGASTPRTSTTSPSPPTPPTGSAKPRGTACAAWPWRRNRIAAAGRTLRATTPSRSRPTAIGSACTAIPRW